MTNTPIVDDIPDVFDLNIPGGTYMATVTFVAVDKAGQWFATSMSSYGVPKGQFGIHVWYRKTFTAPWELIQFRDGCHGNLTAINGKLFFFVNDKDGHVRGFRIKRSQGVVACFTV